LNPFKDLVLLYQLVFIIKKIKPDVVLTYTVKPVVYGMIAARINLIKERYAIITGLGYAFISPNTKIKKILKFIVSFLYKLSLKKTPTVFFQNNDDLNFFRNAKIISSSSKSVRVMGSGVDLDYFKFSTPPSNQFNLLLIARLLKDKGIYEYVEAARIVKDKISNLDINFILLGSYDLNPSSIQPSQIEYWASKGYISYHGEVEDVRPFLKQCSIFVLPSYREGLPRSTLEAMATGRAIITTDAPGCRDTVIENENGLLVPKKSAQKLSLAILSLINNSYKINQMGLKSREIAEEKFDVVKVNNSILKEMSI
jgi:glycosyltransferase involved in cell wall biosynthesis